MKKRWIMIAAALVLVVVLGLIIRGVAQKGFRPSSEEAATGEAIENVDEIVTAATPDRQGSKKTVSDVPGITACNVELTFDPPWDQSMLSDEARLELGLDDVDRNN